MNPLSNETDEELWRRYSQRRDQQSFCLLMKKYREGALAFLIRMTGDEEESLDLLQEAMRRFALHFDPSRSSAKTFLLCIAANLARSHYKRSKKKFEISLDELEESELQIAQPCDSYREETRLRLFQEGLNRLGVKDREAIELKDVEGMTYKSAAEIAGCSEKRFEKRLLQARKRLIQIFTRNKEYECLTPNDCNASG